MDDTASEITLSCSDHHQIFIDRLWNFFLGNQGVDFDIQWGDEAIKVHRLILAVFLPPDRLGHSAPAENLYGPGKVCGVNDCSQLRTMVEFLYKGQVTLPKKQLAQLMEVAREMEFRQLVDAIEAAASEYAIEVEFPGNTANTSDSIETLTVKVKCEVDSEESATEDDTEVDFPENTANASGSGLQITNVKCEFKAEEWAVDCDPLVDAYEGRDVDGVESNARDAANAEMDLRPIQSLGQLDAEMEMGVIGSCRLERPRTRPKPLPEKNEVVPNPDEKSFPCKQCGKVFRLRHHLKSHTLTHTGERPHKCRFCQWTFVQKAHLNRHVAKLHTTPNYYKCTVCSASFTTSQACSAHTRYHHQPRRPPITLKRKLDDLTTGAIT